MRRAWESVARRHKLNVDLLDSLAVVAAVATGDASNAAGIVWLVALGDHIRDLTQARAPRDKGAPRLSAGPRVGGPQRRQGASPGRRALRRRRRGRLYRLGRSIDGTVAFGEAVVDQQSLTGESVPVMRSNGERCFAATVIQEGKLYIQAERVGGDTTAASTVRLIEDAPELVSARQTRPVSQAVSRFAQAWALEVPEREDSRYHVGRRVQARVQGKVIHLGSARLFDELGVRYRLSEGERRELSQGARSLLFLSVDGEHAARPRHARRKHRRPPASRQRNFGLDQLLSRSSC